MPINNDVLEQNPGLLSVTYTNNDGSLVGVEFTSASENAATAVFAVCASTMGKSNGRLVSSSSSGNTVEMRDNGGDDMERRIAVLESDVTRIKTDISELRVDQKTLVSGVSDIKTDIKLALQQLTDINDKLSSNASKDHVDVKVGEVKIWILGVLLLSIAMPTIFFVLNLYMKKP